MVEPRRMSKSELFTHFAERFGIRRAEAGEFFDELQTVGRAATRMPHPGVSGLPR